MSEKRKSLVTISLTALGTLMLVTLVQQVACHNRGVDVFGNSSKSPLVGDAMTTKAIEIQQVFQKISELYNERVVFISTEQTVKVPQHPFFNDPFFRDFFGGPQAQPQTRKRTGLGTGFIISEDGYICTNHHVVGGVDKVKVKINERIYDATVIGSDQKTDIALLKINPRGKLKPAFLGDSDKVKVGDWAIAIGNPFGLDKTFTVGVISATGRKDLDLMGGGQSHIQTDASINPGNSGGPLININGEVIGINRMIYSNSGGSMGIGFAIPINKAKNVLEQLKKYKKIKRGYIGVQIVPLTDEYASELGLKEKEGALVGALVDDGPAQRAGMTVGDVILKVDDTKIKNYSDLVELVERMPVGKNLRMTVWRNKQFINFFVTVKERP